MLAAHVQSSEKVSDQFRIDLILKLRNELIIHFLDEKNLHVYFGKNFKSALNAKRIEFIKKELQDLLISPIDLVHYASLLMEMKQIGTASLTVKNENLFYDELNVIFRKYTP